ncbi:MAG TPA: HAD family phosphatase [Anaerolineaceae bacterium]
MTNPHAIKAVIFDMDGVLIDTYDDVVHFWRLFASEYDMTISDDDFVNLILGRPAESTLDTFFPMLDSPARQRFLERLHEYETNLTYKPMRGARELLQALHSAGVPLALVTSAQPWKAQAAMEQVGVWEWFTARITADDITFGKPNPECYLLAAQKLGFPPANCIVFEDSISGTQAAVKAGMTCIGLGHPARSQILFAAGAAAVLPDLTAVTIHSGVLSYHPSPLL